MLAACSNRDHTSERQSRSVRSMKIAPTRIVEYSEPRSETVRGSFEWQKGEESVSRRQESIAKIVDDGPKHANKYASRNGGTVLSLPSLSLSLPFDYFLSTNCLYTKSRSPLDYTPRINMYRHDCWTSIRSSALNRSIFVKCVCSPARNVSRDITGSRSRLILSRRARIICQNDPRSRELQNRILKDAVRYQARTIPRGTLRRKCRQNFVDTCSNPLHSEIP